MEQEARRIRQTLIGSGALSHNTGTVWIAVQTLQFIAAYKAMAPATSETSLCYADGSFLPGTQRYPYQPGREVAEYIMPVVSTQSIYRFHRIGHPAGGNMILFDPKAKQWRERG